MTVTNPCPSADELDLLCGDDALFELACAVITRAVSLGASIGTAESCTGGLVAGALTMVPGSSEAVNGGIVSYSNEVKQAVLGVAGETLAEFGAVSAQTAEEMAEGARKALDCDLAVSTTGVAGPGGGSADKPVGTVYLGVAQERGLHAELHHFEGDRSRVRRQTVFCALRMLNEALRELDPSAQAM